MLPILFLAQIAFIVAFGVLLDTLVVRSLLVPAVSYDLGDRIWWPFGLRRAGAHEAERLKAAQHHDEASGRGGRGPHRRPAAAGGAAARRRARLSSDVSARSVG